MLETTYKRLCEENEETIKVRGKIEPMLHVVSAGKVESVKLKIKPGNHLTVQKALKSFIAKKENLEGYILVLDTIPTGKMKVDLKGVRCCFRIMYAQKKKRSSGVWYLDGKIYTDELFEGRSPLFTDKWDYWDVVG